MKATLKKIQQFIDREYPGRGINFYKGSGYFYFCGDNYLAQSVDSIYVPYLNCAPLEDWLGWVKGGIDEAIAKEAKGW